MQNPIRVIALGASLMLAGTAIGQDAARPTPIPPPPAGEATPPPPPADNAGTPGTQGADASMPPPAADAPPPPPAQRQISVNSGPAPAKPSGPAPDFATLAGGKGAITAKEASAFPLLANDFQYADANRDGKISKAEYQKWVKKSGASGQ
jgi:hypothetical protein